MKYIFTIPGEAKGKGRPKFARMGNFVKTYTPKDTANYESLVKLYFTVAYPERSILKNALRMSIIVRTAIPKSFSKKKNQLAMDGYIFPTKKPDADNVIKIIADSLNGVAYEDDLQIVSLSYDKYYSTVPYVAVSIEELNNTLL